MRKVLPDKAESGRVRVGYYASDASYGTCGAFRIQGPCGAELLILAGEASLEEAKNWEHVSVSIERRCPNWTEMCFVKDLFWDEDELVIQFHPPKAKNINNHPHCLHLWKCRDGHVRLPPALLV